MNKKLIAILLIFCLVLPTFGVFAEDEETVNIDKINEMLQIIDYHYKYDVSRDELIEGAYRGIMDTLDKHSTYFTPEEFKTFYDDLDGTLIGIGVYIEEEDGLIKIISPIEGSPAMKAGLKTGDIITHVNDESVKVLGFEPAIDKIKGEAGTKVKITITRKGEVMNFEITREVITVPDVSYEMLDDGIGYLRIIQFGTNVSKNVDDALAALADQGMESIIIDLRNNPGGYLDEVVKVADWFIEKDDEILYVDYRNFIDEEYKGERPALNLPTTVLINEGSASASEILAGAIKYNKEGTVIGETSYGKGTVQTLLMIYGQAGVKITTAEYLSTDKTKVDGVGIEPDIVIKNRDEEELKVIGGFAPMNGTSIDHYGVTSLDVFGAQQRLKFLGYDVDLTGVYDVKTSNAISSFQESNNLKDKYALYKETKDVLNKAIEAYLNEDPQLEKAIEILKEANN